MQRVVVTGVGVVSAIGHNRTEFWDSLCSAVCGIGPIEDVDLTQLRFKNGAVVRDFDPTEHFQRRQIDVLDRFAQFALLAAREMAGDAHLEEIENQKNETAVVTGSCLGGQGTIEDCLYKLYGEKRRRAAVPLAIPRAMANAGASHISMEFGLGGPTFTFSTACSSANHAIGHAFWLVRSGAAKSAVAGGSEAPFWLGHLKGWEMMHIVAEETCRPFSKDRDGMILAEGGAMLLLESLDSATARGATIYAEMVGFGMSADAGHITAPSGEGAARAMRLALADGGVDPQQVGYINAHGTGTPANDPIETQAIRQVFGAHADRLVVSSTKSMHGHALGAAGAIEAAATVLAMHHNVLPPTANFNEPDPQCDLDVAPNQSREAEVEYALSNSFAFGGLNAVLAFKNWSRGK